MEVQDKKEKASEKYAKERREEKRRKFIKTLFSRKVVLISTIGVVVFALVAVLAPFLAPYDPNKNSLMECLMGASLAHLFGTDNFGRDIFSRVIYGTRVSLVVGVIAVLFACAIGTFFGMVAGFFGGIVDDVINKVSEAILQRLPSLGFRGHGTMMILFPSMNMILSRGKLCLQRPGIRTDLIQRLPRRNQQTILRYCCRQPVRK